MNNKFKSLACELKLDPNKDVINKLEKDFNEINKRIQKLKSIDTDNIKPMKRINEELQDDCILREDIKGEILNIKTIINNSPQSKNNYIVVKKVVK